jgi:hypothetical protein
MVNFWKILPNNLARVWFGVLFLLITNGHHEGGSGVKSDVTCNDSQMRILALVVSINAPCHFLKNHWLWFR